MQREGRRKEGPLDRYQKLGLRDSFSVPYRYPVACEELSFIIRFAYSKLEKSLQSVVFLDALAAFRLLPEMQFQSAVSAANILIQSVEAALPKQKKVLAVKEFKQAMVAYKRRSKFRFDDTELIELPQDILLHLFSFLDMQSLVTAGMVCRSWNAAASDDCLWQVHHCNYFEDPKAVSADQFPVRCKSLKLRHLASLDATDANFSSFKDSFRRKYKVSPLRNFKHRGHCLHCNTVVWLTNFKCPRAGSTSGTHIINPVLSSHQIINYIVLNSPQVTGSESESDSDEETSFKLWAYPVTLRGESRECVGRS